MVIKYDALNRLEKPTMTLCDPGCSYSNGLLSKPLGGLVNCQSEEFIFNFNSPSELNFRIYMVDLEDDEDDAYVKSIYDRIQNRRLIFVDGIGFFVVKSVEKGYENHSDFKDVNAKSVESELENCMLPYIEDNTYKFYSPNSNSQGMLELIMEQVPFWTIAHVDTAVADRWRTFEDVDTSMNCLAFMIENCQDAYECIFDFNIINREVSVYDKSNYVRATNIHLTKDDLINNIHISEDADDLYTALRVYGDNDLTISALNPIGSNTIYNFSYYLDWMSPALKTKVTAWQNAVDDAMTPYYQLNLQYFNKLAERFDSQAEIDRLNTLIDMYDKCKDNLVANSGTYYVSRYNSTISEYGGTPITIYDEIEETIQEVSLLSSTYKQSKEDEEENLADINEALADMVEDIEYYHNTLSITSYFTASEQAELLNYIFEGKYEDSYVTVSDIMGYDEVFAQMKTLYDRAKESLRNVSIPTQEFNITPENFIFVREFERWSSQIETGCLINVELKQDDVASLFLSNMTINFDDHTLSMTFGNRFNRFDPKALFNNVLGNISRTTNSLSFIKDLVNPIKEGKFNYIDEALRTTRNLTMAAALSSTSEDIVIDETGYTGRILLPNGEYDPRQIKITGRSIVFTDDSWESSKLALGQLILPDGSTVYGVNGEVIMGKLLLGEDLIVYGSIQAKTPTGDETFYVNTETGAVRIKASSFSLTDGTTLASVLDDAEDYADGAASGAVNAQTQEFVFNKLTNNGVEQGIYLENGKIYINASYIQVGSLPANRLDSATQTAISNGTTAYNRENVFRGTCSTANGTAAKVVSCGGFSLATGAAITVYFSTPNTNTAAMTLNVNSTGAKNIYIGGAQQGASNQLLWNSGSSITFVYDGTNYVVADQQTIYYGTQCTVAAATAAKTSTVNSGKAVILRGTKAVIPMQYANTHSTPTLNLNNLTARNIYFGTGTTGPTTANGHGWIAGESVEFIFDGLYWRIQEPATVINGNHITTGTIDASLVTVANINASNITSGTIDASTITVNNIDASKITTGTIAIGRIADGTITNAKLDSTTQTSISNGTTAYNRANSFRGTCGTANGTAAKVVTCGGFALASGVAVTVYFSTANTGTASMTLNVNNTGAKNIYIGGNQQSATNQLLWNSGTSIKFVYDGTNFVVVDQPAIYYGSACTVGASTAAKTSSANGSKAVVMRGTKAVIPMNNANTATSPTLNLNSLGAKNIYYRTGTTGPTTANGHGWIASENVEFIFDGAYWRIQEPATIINGSHITTGTIDASVVTVSNINASNIKTGTLDASIVTVNNLNASNISSGTMSASKIQGGTLKLGGSGNGWGVIQMYDGYGASIGSWNSDGLNLTTSTTSESRSLVVTKWSFYHQYTFLSSGNSVTARFTIDKGDIQIGFWDKTNSRYNLYWKTGVGTAYNNYTRVSTDILNPYKPQSVTAKPHWLIEGSDTVVSSQIDSDYVVNIGGGLKVIGNFACVATKSRIVNTEQYSQRALYCYETPSPMFGDVGEGILDETGVDYIFVDPVFAETISTDQYQIFVQKYGNGDVWIEERHTNYFVAKGTPGLRFGWELKAKQADFDQLRLETVGMEQDISLSGFGDQAADYIQQLYGGRIE